MRIMPESFTSGINLYLFYLLLCNIFPRNKVLGSNNLFLFSKYFFDQNNYIILTCALSKVVKNERVSSYPIKINILFGSYDDTKFMQRMTFNYESP